MKLIGNESLKQRLPSQLSHAYLVAGATGSGRGLLIKHLSKIAQCLSDGEKPCETCRECELIEKGIHPDLGHFGEEKPMNVDAVREMRQDVYTRPHQGRRKIYVVHQADKLNLNGQNALLKILEEPPPYALFFLVTGDGVGVLETIRSRCQILPLRPVSQSQALEYLQKMFPESEHLPEIAQECEGFLGRAVVKLKPPPQEEAPPLVEGLKPVKTRKKSVKEPKKEEKAEIPLENMAKIMENALFSGNELQLLEACQPFRKLDKIQSLALLDLLRSRLSQALSQNRNKNILAWIVGLEEISSALESNVKGEQIACWLTALLWKKGEAI